MPIRDVNRWRKLAIDLGLHTAACVAGWLIAAAAELTANVEFGQWTWMVAAAFVMAADTIRRTLSIE